MFPELGFGGYEYDYNRVMLAERFGWTLDYVDGMTQQDMTRVIGILNGIAKFEAYKQEQARNRAKAKR